MEPDGSLLSRLDIVYYFTGKFDLYIVRLFPNDNTTHQDRVLPFSTVRNCLFNLFAIIFNIRKPNPGYET